MTQFLILHKVRGAPAFDIAEPVKFGDEEGWVLCTCGHRAYPFWFTELDKWDFMEDSGAEQAVKDMPKDWPDHYTQHPETKIKLNVLELVSKMLPKMKRRI